MNPIDIKFILPSLVVGGAERVVTELAHTWISMGHSVEIITFQGLKKDFYVIKTPVIRTVLPFSRKKNPIVNYFCILLELRKIFKRNKNSYFISFLPKSNILSLIATIGIKSKITVCERNIINDPDIDFKQHILRKILYPHAWKVSVQHQEIKDELITSIPSLLPTKIFITPNPVRILDITKSIDFSNIFHQYSKNSNIIIMAIGRFTSVKSFKDLLILFNKAYIKNNLLRLIIIGEGPEHADCQKFILDNQLENSIYLPGQLSPVDPWLSSADIFVNVSKYEGFPNVIAEALSIGLPVVAYDAPSIKILVKNNDNGYVIPERSEKLFIEKLLLLADNHSLRKKLGNEGKSISLKYSMDSINHIWFDEVLN